MSASTPQDNFPYAEERRVALAAVRAACRLTREVQDPLMAGRVSGDEDPQSGAAQKAAIQKSDRSPVTVGDLATQSLVSRALELSFPNDPLVAEETATLLRREDGRVNRDRVIDLVERYSVEAGCTVQSTANSPTANAALDWIDRAHSSEDDRTAPRQFERYWTLDPIDGTKGFLRGQQYAIALALIEHGQVTLGVLACPRLSLELEEDPPNLESPTNDGEILVAIRDHGTYRLASNTNDLEQRLSLTPLNDIQQTRVCESVERAHSAHGHTAQIMQRLEINAPTTRLDSQAKYAAVAGGLADLYLRIPTQERRHDLIWDHAAGAIVVEEAGGVVTDLAGKSLDFGHGSELTANRGFIIARPGVHGAVLDAVRNLGI